ncbi:MAG: glucosaminidase domain-containing protein [Dysgonamonadaceae bacterium]|nr:glucosaminidase domain-containing protein [Dysgonamonadaceae bacterium]
MKIQGRIMGVYCLLWVISVSLSAQKRNPDYVEYIRVYKGLAVNHMIRYKIPASITLAQGLLESGAGKGNLARDDNNHFGIKCHSDWKGKRVYRADDKPNDCFRSYNKVEDSYEDHSLFLLRPRYARLFDLDIRDYAAWAGGLQHCGYATDKYYANKLIKLIEDYELYRYDAQGQSNRPVSVPLRRSIYTDHGLLYVLAETNDSYARIAGDTGFKVSHLAKWNEAPEDFPLRPGDIVYLEKKHKKAVKPYFEHIVRVGESMHSISQQYGMQVKRLYKLNKKDFDYVPEEGNVLRLR